MTKKDKVIPTAVYLKNVGAADVSDNSFFGDARAIHADTVGSVSFKSNTYATTQAVSLFKDFNKALFSIKNDLPEEIFSELIVKVKMMEIQQGRKTFVDSYNSFIACLSNHASVLAPVMPIIQPFIDSLLHLG